MKLRIGLPDPSIRFLLDQAALWQWPSRCCRTCVHGIIAQSHHDQVWSGSSIWTSECHLIKAPGNRKEIRGLVFTGGKQAFPVYTI